MAALIEDTIDWSLKTDRTVFAGWAIIIGITIRRYGIGSFDRWVTSF